MVSPITSMKDAFSLEGKVAVITGGNRGLGFACASAFAQQGAHVAILCRDAQKAAEALEELKQFGGKYKSYTCDIIDRASVRATVAAICEDFGGIDILVNNAGVSCRSELLDMDEELTDWYNVLNADLNGTVHMTYEVGKRMRDAGKGGVIINMASNAAFIVNKTQAMSPYSVAKAGVVHFTRCMANELGKYNIRVNAIAPGFVNTELSKWIPEDQFNYINNQMPLGRFGEPIEVGALAVYFASPASANVTGTTQVIDGGYILSC
ncbi:MAG: SDR family oxidoreductase [Oscillospiraceae bacterium]|nr:SDR family oxidoreductase [Oscillospiraceae bacterium]